MAPKAKTSPLPSLPHRVQSGINLPELTHELSQIAGEGGTSMRNDALAVFRHALTDAMAETREMFEMGRLDGLETARLICAVHEDIVTAIWDFAAAHVLRNENPTKSESLALCAVGGFGRGEMAPKSDLDLLFLLADKKGSAHTEALTEYLLYMLWDLDLKVGHATRTVDQSIRLAKEDQTILTSLLDLRFLRGEQALADQLYLRFRKDISRGAGRAYIAAKLEERDIRHTREGNSRYVIEPNIKEGKGGLRDLHVLYWIARFLDRDAKIMDPQQGEDYVEMGLFDENAATRFVHSADFLWRARHWLHFLSGRPLESLSFDYQTKLSRKMGHASGPIEVAVERFMREYFTNAREVGALTRIACAKLEEQKNIRLPAGLDALLPGSRRNLKNKSLVLKRGRLMLADPMELKNDPTVIMQLFETAGRRNVDIHPDAFSAIDFRRNLMDADFRRDPANSKLFQKLLLGAKAPYATLKAMNEAGVLGRYLLEFGGIVARTQFNMHHAFTVDEHTLRLVNDFDNLLKGHLAGEHPLVTEIAQGFTDQERLTMMLTCLLHDTGKGQGDQCIEGAQLARRACRRMGVSQEVTDTCAWLVRRHLDLSETAQRRDISDPETIAEFAALMGSVERLKLLTVLTVVDIRSVGPGVYNEWKGTLLRNLYMATARYLEGREELAPAAKAASLQEQLRERLSPEMIGRIAPILSDLPDQYWLNFDMTEFMRHARFFDSCAEAGLTTATQTRVNKSKNVTELWVLTQDRASLFADLTKAISALGASITGAQLQTSASGQVFDVFYLHTMEGAPFGEGSAHVLEALRKNSRLAAEGETDGMRIPKPLRSARAGAIPVKSKMRFLDNASGDLTILEMEGRDRPALLYALAKIMRDEDLDVHSAHIEVVGATAIDCFYVRASGKHGALNAKRRKAIRAQLMGVLQDPSAIKTAA